MSTPIVIVPACTAQEAKHPYHFAQMKYVDAVVRGAGCLPLVLPAIGAEIDLETLLGTVHGVLLTGSPSNVHASHYGEQVRDAAQPQDLPRDATTLPLIRAAYQRGIPMLGICLGFQEVNVALGGTLHQAVHEVDGMTDHRETKGLPAEQQYAPVHQVSLAPSGCMAAILGSADPIRVNSLHTQGVARLAPGLAVEAHADDGLVEAYSAPGASGFLLALQWHPEWRMAANPVSMKLFGAFGNACRDYQRRSRAASPV
ncbi:gamma-glutamyl-gamma-aminobutyrate hydrolase family protein [Massilia glaciei]|uniref:gamma-glutamyl-gamma-aminobutyrate hydrolase n=1 Tax=Massilia glaciei TaxID=1524097 RepID=A0A2U2HAV4_9BURK|nr:gamma-glutamyl-gamma-aminobutyrate hydrolase family protein [Massilia glaciei]PWF39890.1 gamma-glutamyl-gamma-aminobutyrate hydrolase family protein [Massilia glaciei]